MTSGPGLPRRPGIRIGRARARELGSLSRLAFRSKAHWGYPAAWLEEWRPKLTLEALDLEAMDVFVARRDGEPLGFYALVVAGRMASLEHLWVDPPQIGKGVGRSLLEHAVRRARAMDCEHMEIIADPYAEPFYRHMGAVRAGTVSAPVAGTERELPRLRMFVAGAGAPADPVP